MKKILNKIDRLRSTKTATLDLKVGHPLYHLEGKKFPVESTGTPGIKCRVTLLIDGNPVDFTIEDVY